MATTRSIAAAQTVSVPGDVDANIAQHARLVELAAIDRPRVLVFPELSLTGYELERAEPLAFSPRDPRLDPLRDAAAAASMVLVAGAPVRLGSLLHIGAFIISPAGDVDLYTKRHLGAFPANVSSDGVVPPAEASVFVPGDRDPLVNLDGHTAAVAVCADTGQPSHAQAAAERGATAYLASMFVIPSDFDGEVDNLRTLARRHGMTVVFANHGGSTGGLPSAGRSAIWSETGDLIAALGAAGAGVVVATRERTGWRGKAIALRQ